VVVGVDLAVVGELGPAALLFPPGRLRRIAASTPARATTTTAARIGHQKRRLRRSSGGTLTLGGGPETTRVPPLATGAAAGDVGGRRAITCVVALLGASGVAAGGVGRAFATSTMLGRTTGSADIILVSIGVSGPLWDGGSHAPEATRCSTAIGFGSSPNGGLPSTAMYSVAPREYTSLAKSDAPPRATSGAR
jgi:hypothetical protein